MGDDCEELASYVAFCVGAATLELTVKFQRLAYFVLVCDQFENVVSVRPEWLGIACGQIYSRARCRTMMRSEVGFVSNNHAPVFTLGLELW